jgi:hypothetical protein
MTEILKNVSDSIASLFDEAIVLMPAYLEDTLPINDEVMQTFEESVTSSISINDTLEHARINLYNAPSDTIAFTESAVPTRILPKTFSDTLTLESNVIKIFDEPIIDTLTFTDDHDLLFIPRQEVSNDLELDDAAVDTVLKGQHLTHDFNLIHSFSAGNNFDQLIDDSVVLIDELYGRLLKLANLEDSLTLTDEQILFIFDVKQILDEINISDSVDFDSLVEQATTSTVGINDSVTVINLAQQNNVDNISLTDSHTYYNLPQFDDVVNLTLSDVVSNTVFPGQNLEEILNVVSILSMDLDQVKSLCDCLSLTARAFITKEQALEDGLTLTDSVLIDPFIHDIGITDEVTTNALEGSCCDGHSLYVPDKSIIQSLELEDLIGLGNDDVNSVVQELELLSTAAYYTV